jgi:hypothetical protein
MRISLINDSTGNELSSKSINIFKIKCIKDVKINKRQVLEAFDLFKKDINEERTLTEEELETKQRLVSENSFCPKTGKQTGSRRKQKTPSFFTKLPFLYVDLENDGMFQYPYMYSPSRESSRLLCSGHGRSLIHFRYFPDMTNDVIDQHPDWGIGGFEVIEEVVHFVSHNKYWKDKNPEVCSVSLVKHDDIWYMNNIDFISEDYANNHANFRPRYFVEMTCKLDLWEMQRDYILNVTGKVNVKEMLDKLVLSHLDYARQNYDWKV